VVYLSLTLLPAKVYLCVFLSLTCKGLLVCISLSYLQRSTCEVQPAWEVHAVVVVERVLEGCVIVGHALVNHITYTILYEPL
jgi:hypothetical protein